MMDFGWIDNVDASFQQNKQWTVDSYYYRKSEDRANDAVQRHVRDLQAAGLSPMLAYGHGNQSAAVPQAPAARAHRGSYTPSVQSVSQARLMQGQTDLLKAQEAEIYARIERESATAGQARAQTDVLRATLPKIVAEIKEINASGRLKGEQSVLTASEADKLRQMLPLLKRIAQDDAYRSELGLPKAENMSAVEKSWWGMVRQLIPGAGFIFP